MFSVTQEGFFFFFFFSMPSSCSCHFLYCCCCCLPLLLLCVSLILFMLLLDCCDCDFLVRSVQRKMANPHKTIHHKTKHQGSQRQGRGGQANLGLSSCLLRLPQFLLHLSYKPRCSQMCSQRYLAYPPLGSKVCGTIAYKQ